MSIDTHDIIHVLKAKNALTPENLDHILSYIADDVADRGTTSIYKVKTVTLSHDILKEMNFNYSYQLEKEFVPEPEVVSEEPQEDMPIYEIVPDEDIEEAIAAIERNELKEELIALEESEVVSESELNELEPESNNNQIEQTNDTDDFEWF
jgi:hypothetical protein